jgi:integrase
VKQIELLLDQEWMEPAALAGRLGVTETTLTVWRSTGRGPASLKLGRRVVYPKSFVETWLQSLREARNGNANTGRSVALPSLHRRSRGRVEDNRFGRKRLKSDPSTRKPGRHLTKLNNSHDQACRDAGVSFVPYDLRHTFATRLAQSGCDLASLAAILGHASLRMVMRYVHPTSEHQKEAMKKFEATLRPRLKVVG